MYCGYFHPLFSFKGEFGVTDTVSFADGMDEKELLKYAAAIEKHSEHPIAKGITASVEKL